MRTPRRRGCISQLFGLFILCLAVVYAVAAIIAPWSFHIGGRMRLAVTLDTVALRLFPLTDSSTCSIHPHRRIRLRRMLEIEEIERSLIGGLIQHSAAY